MRVYVVRHGQSENNLKGLWTGWYDAKLTEKGFLDAKKAKAILSGVKFDKVFSSDLKRAEDTLKTALPDYEYETSSLIREINVGNLANKPLSSISAEDKHRAFLEGYTVFGGESKDEFHNRVKEFMKRLEGEDYKNVAVFAHAGWLRTVLDLVVGMVIPRSLIMCNNCTVGIFDYTDGVWKLHSWINCD